MVLNDTEHLSNLHSSPVTTVQMWKLSLGDRGGCLRKGRCRYIKSGLECRYISFHRATEIPRGTASSVL